jgi:hypothetical protein
VLLSHSGGSTTTSKHIGNTTVIVPSGSSAKDYVLQDLHYNGQFAIGHTYGGFEYGYGGGASPGHPCYDNSHGHRTGNYVTVGSFEGLSWHIYNSEQCYPINIRMSARESSVGIKIDNSAEYLLHHDNTEGIGSTAAGKNTISAAGDTYEMTWSSGSVYGAQISARGGLYVYGGSFVASHARNIHYKGTGNSRASNCYGVYGKSSNAYSASYGGYFYGGGSNLTPAATAYGVYGVVSGTAGGGKYSGYFSGGDLACTANIIAYVSDKKLKKDLIKIGGALDKIKTLTGYKFVWNDKASETKRGVRDVGLIAQEVQKVLPEAIEDFHHSPEEIASGSYDGKLLNVQYQKLAPLFVEAFKEQQEQIDKLQSKLEKLEKKFEVT